MCSKKWYLKRNISCDVHLLNELLETDVPWDDAIVVSAGKLGKLRVSLSELRSSLCERRLERTVLRPALLPVKTAQFNLVFPSHSKIAQFNWECIRRFRYILLFRKIVRLSYPKGQALHCWNLKMKALRSFQTTKITHPTTQGHIPEYFKLVQEYCLTLKVKTRHFEASVTCLPGYTAQQTGKFLSSATSQWHCRKVN